MQIQDVNGNTVEISDESPLAKTAQNLQALGYTSIDEYDAAKKAETAALNKRIEDKEAMITRNGNELGELRKKLTQQVAPAVPDTSTGKQDTAKTPEEVEAEFGRRVDKIQATMTSEEKLELSKQFSEFYNAQTPEVRASLKTNEGRASYLENVYKGTESAVDEVSLFGTPKAKVLSISEQVQAAFAKQNGTARPVIGSPRGLGITQDNNAQQKSAPVRPSMITRKSGNITDMLASMQTQEK